MVGFKTVLFLLKFLFLLLIYLFLLLVIRAIIRDVRKVSDKKGGASIKDDGSHLKITSAEEQEKIFPLAVNSVIGRSAEAEIFLTDEYASSNHARIFKKKGLYFVEDLGSTNGTLLNDRKISRPTRLFGGDKIKIGNTIMEFME